ncbi:MAG: GTP-binding protein, partial [SAR324 cluster bacterium]|nr:GTP-binding protein [SAR324 cluster bacterium]
MPSYTTANIRNIVFVGHAGSGKTSLVEALLLEGGALHQKGLVESASTVSDFTDEEKKSGYSIFSSISHCKYGEQLLNFLDTPGYADFIGQSLSFLPAADTAAIVISATAGIEPVTRKMMERAAELNLARMIVITKIDAENIHPEELVKTIRETFGKECLPINLPSKDRNQIIDCFYNTEGESEFSSISAAHQQIVDQVVEVDEDLMSIYLEQGDVTPEQLHGAFVRALKEGHLIPICFVSSRVHTNPQNSVGIKELLKVFAELSPSPLEANPRYYYKCTNPESPIEYVADVTGHLLAHV